MHARRPRGTLVAFGLVSLASLACGGSSTPLAPTEPSATSGGVASLSVTPRVVQLAPGETVRLAVVAKSSSGNPVSVANDVVWSTSDSGIASIAQDGRVTAVTPGDARLTARVGGVSTSVDVRVTQPTTANGPPTRVTARSLSMHEVEVTWFDNMSGESYFSIERETLGSDGAWTSSTAGVAPANARRFRDTGLTSGATYRYVVRACDQAQCYPGPGEPVDASRSPEVETTSELLFPSLLLPDGLVGTPFTAELLVTGGDGVYDFSVVPGSELPPGLAMDPATGTMSGIPQAAGDFQTLVTVESGGQSAVALILSYFADLSGRG